jgi:hypothetical protein
MFAPVLFLSFIFSLLIIDRRRSASILSSPRGSTLGSPGRGSPAEKESHGYYHSHQRKLAKDQIAEAFAIRGKVIVGMCILVGLGFVGMWAIGLKIWVWFHG